MPETPPKFICISNSAFPGTSFGFKGSYDDSNDSSVSLIQRLQKDLCYI